MKACVFQGLSESTGLACTQALVHACVILHAAHNCTLTPVAEVFTTQSAKERFSEPYFVKTFVFQQTLTSSKGFGRYHCQYIGIVPTHKDQHGPVSEVEVASSDSEAGHPEFASEAPFHCPYRPLRSESIMDQLVSTWSIHDWDFLCATG